MLKKLLSITPAVLLSCALLFTAAAAAETDGPAAYTAPAAEQETAALPEEVSVYATVYGEESPYLTAGSVPAFEIMGSWTYTLVHEYVINNSGRSVAFNVRVETPLLDGRLPDYVTLDGEVFTPDAVSVETDAQGHRTAVYTLDHIYGNQSVTLSQRYIINVSSLNYTFDRTNVPDEYTASEASLLNEYFLPGDGIDSNSSAVRTFTNNAIQGVTDPYQRTRALFSAVNLFLTYEDDPAADQSAATVIARGTANCQGYANLYAACLRATGIAAKRQNGYLYLPQEHTTSEYVDPVTGSIKLNYLRHAWVEFYLPDTGWVTADPTFTYTFTINGAAQKFVDWSYFANIPPQRRYIFFREGSLDGETVNYSYSAAGGGGQNVSVNFNAYLQPGAHWEAFTDIEGHWAQGAVSYCVNNHLFNGVSRTSFAPDKPMTRAMFVTVTGRLYELLGGNIDSGARADFRDINNSDYYAPYLAWAVNNGLIRGYGDGLFGPDNPVNREQMAKIISDFAAMMGQDVSVYEGALLNFTDGNRIAVWARAGVGWCSGNSIITGMPGNVFSPQTNATRAQVAAIMQRTALFFGANE